MDASDRRREEEGKLGNGFFVLSRCRLSARESERVPEKQPPAAATTATCGVGLPIYLHSGESRSFIPGQVVNVAGQVEKLAVADDDADADESTRRHLAIVCQTCQRLSGASLMAGERRRADSGRAANSE